MVPSLKAAVALLSLLQLIPAMPAARSPRTALSEITRQILHLRSGVQVPCNDTRVAQVDFTDRKQLTEQDLLCQAVKVLSSVTKCQKDYESLITNLRLLQVSENCSLKNDTEIYLRHFLPALGNFTQGMYRWRPGH